MGPRLFADWGSWPAVAVRAYVPSVRGVSPGLSGRTGPSMTPNLKVQMKPKALRGH